MLAGDVSEIRQTILLEWAKNHDKSYGDYFQKFSIKISQTFDKIIKVSFSEVNEKHQLTLAIVGTIIFIKNLKYINGDRDTLSFLNQSTKTYKELLQSNENINVDKVLETIHSKIQSPVKMREVIPLDNYLHNYVYELISLIAPIPPKSTGEALNEQQIRNIGKFFLENIYVLNYDSNKDCLRQVPISHKNIYLLKAKKMYLILLKEQDIQKMQQGFINHQQLAAIFNIQNQLQGSPKISTISSDSHVDLPSQVKTSSLKGSNIKSTIKGSQSSIQQNDQIFDLSSSRLKHSVLFPEEVSCGVCYKKCSEFSALFWSYAHYCFECILDPRVDISFITSNIVEKFLKNQKISYRQYVIICSECQSDTILGNYKPWDKPKAYRCKVCLKDICIQHQKMINQCFCRCQKCDEDTLTIQHLFLKLCLSCRARVCEICNNKSRVDCECICQTCGRNKLVDHEECNPRCHFCKASDIPLMECKCKKRLCCTCYFISCQPRSNICSPDIK